MKDCRDLSQVKSLLADGVRVDGRTGPLLRSREKFRSAAEKRKMKVSILFLFPFNDSIVVALN